MHIDGQGAVPLAPKGAGSIAQPHVLRFGHALGFTARQQQGRTAADSEHHHEKTLFITKNVSCRYLDQKRHLIP